MRSPGSTKIAAVALAAGVCATPSIAEGTFRVYGYLDAQASKTTIAENNPLRLFAYEEGYQVALTHVNSYFDWQPTDYSRVLVETNLHPEPVVSDRPMSRTRFDEEAFSASVRASVYTAFRAGVAADPNMAAIPQPMRDHMIDSIASAKAAPVAEAQIAAMVPGIRQQIESQNQDYVATQRSKYFLLERAQADLLFSDALNLRVGRFITPAGVWNVDHGSPVILTIKQPYQVDLLPIFPIRQEGAMLFGRAYLGEDDIEYNAYLSTGRQAPETGRQSIEAIDDFGVGGRLTYRPGSLPGSHLGVSGYVGRLQDHEFYVDIPIDVTNIDPATGQPAIPPVENWNYTRTELMYVREFCAGTDAVLRKGQARLQGEVNYRLLRDDNGTGETGHYLGWYAIGSYDIPIKAGMLLTPYLMYEQVTTDNLAKIPGDGLGKTFINGFRSAIAGLNISLRSNVRLKLEYNYGRIIPQAAIIPPSTDLSESDLGMHAVQSQLSVAF